MDVQLSVPALGGIDRWWLVAQGAVPASVVVIVFPVTDDDALGQ
jgi:hypothetical protein